ncbi:MAG TPA: S-formylglutathione hydrolase, partial [Hyphomicrobiales bacterium]|nr:S-formylglutathione hydrolase [Hyphomicrobiales bacterium]
MSLEQVSANKMFGGKQLKFKHHSSVLKCDMIFSVYLPPNAKADSKVPVIYWLSGLTCTDDNFVQKAGAQQYAADAGVAIVCPDTSPRGEGVPDDAEKAYDFGLGAGFYVNATQAPWSEHYHMYDYVTKELPQVLEQSELPLDTANCSIMGHSMGGHGALTIALKNPGIYKAVSAFSPICSPLNCPWGEKALGNYIGADRKA